jgi:DNA-binding Xre family transcriptional regulator
MRDCLQNIKKLFTSFTGMEREIKKLKIEVTNRLYILHKAKFDGNNVHLAKASGCAESTIRNIFAKLTNKDKGQDITLSMAFRLCNALDVELSDLVKDLGIKKESEKKKTK